MRCDPNAAARSADVADTELHRPQLRSSAPYSPAARVRSPSVRSSMERALPERAISNKNVEWLSAPGAWTFVVALIVLSWLLISLVVDPGLAWTFVHLLHGAVTYPLLHWNKGSPVQLDQGRYDGLTFWEQLDDGVQHTATRKFFTALPVVLFLLASHGTDYGRQPLGLNLIALAVLVIAKLPALHKVRILGINKY
ncbi:hypothetical protein WJX81_002407 [Elliptochloris bilobata]|uniref:ORMDL family protein n=1 Tax=Elliptochloris bilobata TaxID=381761 RepID=A0AAW1QA94_9CHLO